MAWNGIMCTKLSAQEPNRPPDGQFPPEEGWHVGYLVPVKGQDDGKELWGCAVVAMADEDYDAYMTWSSVQKLRRPDPV